MWVRNILRTAKAGDLAIDARRIFHTTSSLTHRSYKLSGKVVPDSSSSLWHTTLPNKSVTDLVRKGIWKRKKMKAKAVPCGPLVISCKREEFNHYRGRGYKKFDVLPLASKGWHSKKANGDYFSIHPIAQNPAFLLPEGFEEEHVKNNEDEFESLGVSDVIVERLKRNGYSFPTSIQLAAIPKILQGNHICMTGETGCGKTLAYVIPMVEQILKCKQIVNIDYNSPLGLIIVPTRELALQVGEVITKLIEGMDLTCKVVLAEGTKKFLLNLSADDIEYVDILVGTLGVMCKLTYHNVYNLQNCIHVVLDEADTLLDDSFIDKLQILLERCRFRQDNRMFDEQKSLSGAQLSCVSATIPQQLNKTVDRVFPSSALERVSTKYLHKILPHIKQNFVRCRKSSKPDKILRIVRNDQSRKCPVMIFCNKTDTCNWLAHFLTENSIECARMNAHMSNEDRVEELRRFRDGRVNVLCATDIASRGHDIPRVRHVVNYEFPRFMADYVHRCGRTGRIGNDLKCEVTSLISSVSEVPLLNEIEIAARRETQLSGVNNNIARLLYNKQNALIK